jgi:hypothetical protein
MNKDNLKSMPGVWWGLMFLLASSGICTAQSQEAEQKAGASMIHIKQAATYDFIGSEISIPDKVIRGFPYSAKAISTTTQTLIDGNRIVRRTTASIHRDSEGRTRREQMLPTIGPWSPETEEIQLVTIHDPVKGISYTLNNEARTAKKLMPHVVTVHRQGDDKGKGHVTIDVVATEKHASASARAKSIYLSTKGESHAEGHAEGMSWTIHSAHRDKHEEKGTAVTEELGSRTIEGILAEGKRTIRTIPAGEIGNEFDIEIVTETWFSEELGVIVLKEHKDPRFGETVYRLTEITLEEPDPSLFDIPANFEIK